MFFTGILFWNIVYKQVIDWESKHANYWKFVKLEDLSNNPHLFNDLYNYCELEFSDRIKNKIISLSNSSQKWVTNNSYKYDSLTKLEKDKIIEKTYDVWKFFYTEKQLK